MGILGSVLGSKNDLSHDPVAQLINNGDTIQDLNGICEPLTQLAYQKFAIELCIDLLATYVARTDWRYYEKKKHTSHQIESLLNVRPNPVQTSTEFFKHWVSEMLWNQQALVVQHNNSLYVASEYTVNMPSFDSLNFTDVYIFDKKAPKQRYSQSEAFLLNMQNGDLFSLLRSYQRQYGKLLQSAVDGFQTNKTKRYIMTNPTYRAQTTEVQDRFNEMLERNLHAFANGTGKASLYAKPKDVELEDFSDKQIASASDARGLMEDIFNRTANAFHIPPAYLYGQTLSENELQAMLRDAVLPLVELFQQGINDFQFKELQYRNGTMVKADTMRLQLVDLNKTGTFIKNVLPTGVLTLGDISERYLQGDALPADIADLRVITKNYATVEDFVSGNVAQPTATTVNEEVTQTEEEITDEERTEDE